MASVIVLDNSGNDEQTVRLVQNLKDAHFTAISVVTSSNRIKLQGAKVLKYSHDTIEGKASIAQVLRSALGEFNGTFIALIDSTIDLESQSAKDRAFKAANNFAGSIGYSPMSSGSGALEFSEDLSTEELVSFISNNEAWPIGFMIVNSGAISMPENSRATTARGLIASIAVNAIAAGHKIERLDAIVSSSEDAFMLTSVERAAALNAAISSSNIEELFPNHDWDNHSEESAALCFHTLAATFIKLNDCASAIECLALGDRLEDSPRSLALRGLIARRQGETLEAVAQMVSSLQQYEIRKRENEKHYVSFDPKDLKNINSSLHNGLDALNKRDNSSALEHFSKAVYDFDEFFKDCGL